ncbi:MULTISPECIES: beta-ketoacyl synthase N-terminal-like domain-containing protein [Amycolatopsis]|uniref:Beta-ketoacyl synthase N-terminal-like domain-containing protein n=2 Tax=Amycolatopsis TaxID=1813 RepID=A0ABW5IA53_9PSEU
MNTVDRLAVVTGVGAAIAGESPASGPLRTMADPLDGMSRRVLRHKDRATRLALASAQRALSAAQLTDAGARTGVVVSTNFGNLDTVCDTVDTIAEQTYLGTSPMLLPSTASNVVASWLAITYGARAVNLTLCNGSTSGLDAVHWGRMVIAAGRADRALVVGVEPGNQVVDGLLDRWQPAGRRSLDGAVALVLETPESAAERGVRPIAQVGAYARTGAHADAVFAVAMNRRIGLWCVPEDGANDGEVPGAQRYDVAGTLDATCSGALGVLQCAAGAGWLADGSDDAVLATAGRGGVDDATAALLLTPIGGAA